MIPFYISILVKYLVIDKRLNISCKFIIISKMNTNNDNINSITSISNSSGSSSCCFVVIVIALKITIIIIIIITISLKNSFYFTLIKTLFFGECHIIN